MGDVVQYIFRCGAWSPLPGDTRCLLTWDVDPILSLQHVQSSTSLHNETPYPVLAEQKAPHKLYFAWGQSNGVFF